MKNKGFTLVELIVVIVILVIITSIIVVNLSGIQNNTNEVKLKNYERKISSAACQYIDKSITNMEELELSTVSDCSRTSDVLKTRNDCKDNAGGCYVCISTLIDEGLIDQNLIDPNTNQPVKNELNDIKVLVKWKQNSDGDKIKECTYIGKKTPSESIDVNISKTIYFDYNGGWGLISERNVEVGKKIDTLPTGTRDGYYLIGWFTAKNGGIQVTENTIMGSSNMYLYAHWSNDIRTLTFNSQGGSDCLSVNAAPNTPWGPLCAPTKDGNLFAGWYTATNGSGTKITESSIATSNLTVYANWNSDSYTMTYNADGGTFGSNCSPKTVASGTKWGTLCSITKTGYSFAGWYTEKNGGGTRILSSTLATSNVNVYPKWIYYEDNVTLQVTNGTAKWNSTTSSTNKIVYNGTETIKITPKTNGTGEAKYYLESYSCDSGLTISGIHTGYSYQSTQTGTIKKTATGSGNKKCTFTFSNQVKYKINYNSMRRNFRWETGYWDYEIATPRLAMGSYERFLYQECGNDCETGDSLVFIYVDMLQEFYATDTTRSYFNITDSYSCTGGTYSVEKNYYLSQCPDGLELSSPNFSGCYNYGPYRHIKIIKLTPTSDNVVCNVTFREETLGF